MKDLTKGNIFKILVAFAASIFIGNLLQLTYNLIDTKIVGQVLGEDSLAAVGATNSVNTLVVGFLNGLTNGFAVVAAQVFGAGRIKKLRETVAAGLAMGIGIAVVLTVLVLVFLRPLLCMLNTPADILDLSYDYIFIIFAGMTVLMLYNLFSSFLRAIGDTVIPLVFLGVSVALNIYLDWIFMTTFNMGVKGAAYASVLSQFIAMTACVIYTIIRYPFIIPKKEDFIFDKILYKNMITTGMSMGLMGSMVSFGTVALQTAINKFGKEIIIAHTTARKLTEMFMLFFAVMGTTMATFCGQNMGAGEYKRIKKGIKTAVIIGWVWCVGVIVLSYTLVPSMVSVLASTDKREIIDTAALYLQVDTCFYFVTAMITILRNSMQGIGDKITPLISSFIELAGKVIIVIFLVPYLGYMGIILSEPIVWILMVIPLIVQIIRNPVLRRAN